MATWFPVRHNLQNDPAIIQMAAELGESINYTVGACVMFWSWCDQESRDGSASGATVSWLDRYIGATGFAQAMKNVGWLQTKGDNFSVPNFETYMGKSAKKRLLATKNAQSRRSDVSPICSASVATKRRLQNRTEQNIKNPLTPKGAEGDLAAQIKKTCFGDRTNAAEDKRIHKAAASLLAKAATPDQVVARWRSVKDRWPDKLPTINSLVKHWSSLGEALLSSRTPRAYPGMPVTADTPADPDPHRAERERADAVWESLTPEQRTECDVEAFKRYPALREPCKGNLVCVDLFGTIVEPGKG